MRCCHGGCPNCGYPYHPYWHRPWYPWYYQRPVCPPPKPPCQSPVFDGLARAKEALR